jgi:Calcineurin-like phosphoesterase
MFEMKKVRLIQIGDIHWPQYKDEGVVDLKDDAFPPRVIKQIEINPLQISMRGVLQHCQEGTHAVLICGDLTSWGDLDGYRECIRYLAQSLFSSCQDVEQSISVVPGNHDIDRSKCDPDGTDVYKKFEPLEDAWKSVAPNILPTREMRQKSISIAGDCNFAVFAINSCIGCGEQRYLPQQIKSELRDLFNKVLSTSSRNDRFDLLGEVLDTPAFSADEIDKVRHQIDKMSIEVLPIILSHHNILPQKRPRVSLYSEVLNAGYVRSRLSRCRRPVIYCHGHIHQDPVEIVAPPDLSASRLICISAPEFKDGFNLIELYYGERNQALGCVVRPVRIGDDGALEDKNEIRIPLQSSRDREKVAHQRMSEFLGGISRGIKRFHEIVTDIRKHAKSTVRESTVADVLLECEWLGLVQITNRNDEKKHWQIRGLI